MDKESIGTITWHVGLVFFDNYLAYVWGGS